MKSKYFIAILIAACVFFSCERTDVYEDKIYFSGTEETTTKRLAVDLAPVIYPVNIAASSLVKEDVTVNLEFANDLVESYNKNHGTVYKALPDNSYELSSHSATIKTGSATSEPVNMIITSLEGFEDGTVYLLPLKITQTSGLSLLESCSVIYLVINRTIITQAADFNDRYFPVNQYREMDNLKALNAFTYETRIKVHQFKNINDRPASVTVMGIEEKCVLRFGDVTIDRNRLQLTSFGKNLTSSTQFNTEVWYHIAVTYDGSMIRMYVNGDLDASIEKTGTLDLTATNPATTDKTQGFFLGRAADNLRTIKAVFSETRVWTVARTQNELRNNMCYVDPQTPGLLSYWRFNEGSGIDIKDYSPNGINIKATGAFPWVNGVRCEP